MVVLTENGLEGEGGGELVFLWQFSDITVVDWDEMAVWIREASDGSCT